MTVPAETLPAEKTDHVSTEPPKPAATPTIVPFRGSAASVVEDDPAGEPPPPPISFARKRRRTKTQQALRDIERGLTLAFRRDSRLFMLLFAVSLLIAVGWVLAFPLTHWAVTVVSLTTVAAAETFRKILRSPAALGFPVAPPEDDEASEDRRNADREFATALEPHQLATAAVFLTTVGATGAVLLLIVERVLALLA